MHIPDGFLNHSVSLFSASAALTAVGFAMRKARQGFLEKVPVFKARFATFPPSGNADVQGWQYHVSKWGQQKMWRMAGVGSLIFAAQMVNFPIAGGTSGHLLGGVLAALILGPYEALLVISAVLLVQAFAFGDGGIAALGANIFNMGLIGTLGGYWCFVLLRNKLKRYKLGMWASAWGAAWLSVTAAAACASAELALSGTAPFMRVLSAMLEYHAVIGLGEAVITVVILRTLARRNFPLALFSGETSKSI
ncbi:MAG: energy-coupling factor ABC transporter permease [Patescibacteria group bacterium]